ncbi:hypothetical protein M3M35_04200 [Fructilactobacillus myrtifloralis]|uniref:Uncharacterized protein n=1 Tax=Fructilactobacillus myrtifloralis TaxID=2940301 RepID=A0ABY5BQM3_9LACO|nr:hypothetical protein [Fructilactobacillus myrtifloralis]USS84528.1 hypothetical protein M3M35_04200 [Fructilactobacillus myrtifloralis]
MDDDYYELLKMGRETIEYNDVYISTIKIPYLILLKAKAHLDISNRGKIFNHADKTKHRNDIFRLIPYIDLEHDYDIEKVPKSILEDLNSFIILINRDTDVNKNLLHNLKVDKIITVDEIKDTLNKMAGNEEI